MCSNILGFSTDGNTDIFWLFQVIVEIDDIALYI